MSKLVGMRRAMAMSMSKRDAIKKLMSSGLGRSRADKEVGRGRSINRAGAGQEREEDRGRSWAGAG